MLDVLRRSQRWLMGGVIFFVGAVFVAYLGVGGPRQRATTGGALVELGERRYSLSDVQRIREDQEQRLREGLGEAFDAAAAGPYLDQLAAQQIVSRAVAASEAERVGLRATDDEIRALVRTVFRTPEGTLDADSVRAFAERRYGSERRFANEVRDDILSAKLFQLIDSGVAVSDAEIRDAIRYRKEEVRLAIVALDPSKLADPAPVEEAEVAQLLANDGPRVRRFYDEHPERYHVPERVRARHVLFRVTPDASEDQKAQVRARAQAALERIQGGEDLAAVATELSEDPGSKERGGDLGFFPRGQMAPAFEQAAFALQPGQTSELVETDFGFHVIRVEDRQSAQDRSYDEAAREISEELIRTDRARARADEVARALAEQVRGGKSLVDAAREADVTIERPDWIARRPDGFVPGAGASPELLDAAFALTQEKPSTDRIFEIEDKRVLIELLERRGPTPEDLAAELASERERLLEARRGQARQAWLEQARERLVAAGELRIDLTPLQPPPEASG
jgi:peptidyl-prolyl cis-trans isomerase D